MENSLPMSIRTIRIYSHALWPYERPRYISKNNQSIFNDMLDQGMLAFLDDITLYAETIKELDKLTIEVLKQLRDNGLCIAPDKCEWQKQEIEFLGYMLSGNGNKMCDDKVKTIKEIQPVKSLKEVQHFLEFANFYRRFIRNYSKIALPLSNSTAQPATEWKTSKLIQQAQETLKRAFCEAPALTHFDPAQQAIVETDASDFALGAILSQGQGKDQHPVAFHSQKIYSSRNKL